MSLSAKLQERSNGLCELCTTETANEAYAEKRLDSQLTSVGHLAPEEVLESLLQDVTRHAAGASQSDDITIAALKWQPATS